MWSSSLLVLVKGSPNLSCDAYLETPCARMQKTDIKAGFDVRHLVSDNFRNNSKMIHFLMVEKRTYLSCFFLIGFVLIIFLTVHGVINFIRYNVGIHIINALSVISANTMVF